MLIGRDGEDDLLRRTAVGPGITVVVGAPGLGKTELVRACSPPDAVWVHGIASLRDRPGSALATVLVGGGDAERDASQLMRLLGGRALVFDDAQWADEHTIAVIDLVAAHVPVVATWRTGDPSAPAGPPPTWVPVPLAPLDPAAARALARRVRPDLAGPDLERLMAVAAGSPLLIEELASDGPVQPNLVSALLVRLHDLPGPVRATALLVMAAHGALAVEHLDTAHLDALEASGLVVVDEQRCRPRHALLQESALEVVARDEVQAAHHCLSELLADTDVQDAALHAWEAGDLARASVLARRAVTEADEPVEAARATMLLADIIESAEPEVALRHRVEAAKQLRELGAHRDVIAGLLGRASPDLDPVLAASVLLNLAAAHWDLGETQAALEEAQKALALSQGTRSEAELLVRGGLAMYQTRVQIDGHGAIDDARAALEIALERGEHVAFARTRVAAALVTAGDPGWRAEADAAVGDAMSARLDADEAMAREGRYLHAFITGDLETSADDLLRVGHLERQLGRPASPRRRAYVLLIDLVRMGDRTRILAETERLLDEHPIFSQRSVALAVAATAAIDLGRPDLARPHLASRPQLSDEEHLILDWARAELAWTIGAPVKPLVAEGDAVPLAHPAATLHAVCAAWSCAERDQAVGPAPLVLLPGFAASGTEVEALILLQAGDLRQAIERFDAAARDWQLGSDRRGVLRCEWGAAWATHRLDASDAHQRLIDCYDQAVARGTAPVAARARRALRDRGVRRHPTSYAAQAPLSPVETHVLRTLAAGFTTDQVATTMGVEVETIGDHTASAVRKLHLSTRGDAIRWVAER